MLTAVLAAYTQSLGTVQGALVDPRSNDYSTLVNSPAFEKALENIARQVSFFCILKFGVCLVVLCGIEEALNDELIITYKYSLIIFSNCCGSMLLVRKT